MNRLRHEIVTLRRLVSSQQQMMSSLTASCEQLRREKYLIGSLRSFCMLNACASILLYGIYFSLVAFFVKCLTNLQLTGRY